ncbi:hypothetical protein [Bacillus safensis]|uniref:Uncharacterized protein n=1 Tax=Bacillus safensis TaxID=561879 RepID=A0A1L6ZP86_BACIA|nr:hypothetical protein [Bacillus safensis]APT48327.1 hypothetical protein BSA145_20910 [Bacillus safensis]
MENYKGDNINVVLSDEEELVLYYRVPSRCKERIYEYNIGSIEQAEEMFKSMGKDEEVTDILIVKRTISKEVIFKK